MWAGVAGGMAEYFDIDPSLVRLLWVAAAVVSGGLAVPVYILLWIILPRDDRPVGPNAWHDWSEEFHNETRRMAEEARRVADDVREASHGWRAPEPGQPTSAPPPPTSEPTTQSAATDKGVPTGDTYRPPAAAGDDPWWQSERYVERRRHRHNPRATGVVLVTLGIFLLAANAGLFSWINWHTMWPLIFIGLGAILLAKQAGWGR
jgi:phage shock protein PspC (stress-responsive transcriptional regulator)